MEGPFTTMRTVMPQDQQCCGNCRFFRHLNPRPEHLPPTAGKCLRHPPSVVVLTQYGPTPTVARQGVDIQSLMESTRPGPWVPIQTAPMAISPGMDATNDWCGEWELSPPKKTEV